MIPMFSRRGVAFEVGRYWVTIRNGKKRPLYFHEKEGWSAHRWFGRYVMVITERMTEKSFLP